MDCYATTQKPVNNQLQSLYHSCTKAFLNNVNDYLTYDYTKLTVFTRKFFSRIT